MDNLTTTKRAKGAPAFRSVCTLNPVYNTLATSISYMVKLKP